MTATMKRASIVAGLDSQQTAAASVYRGTVRHRRFGRTPRTFAPRLFMAYLDVDALPGSLDSVPMWSARRSAPLRFRRRDFFDGRDGPLGPAVRELVEAELQRRPAGQIYLLAHLRTFGYVFNPLAVYYCWDPDGERLDAIVLEVTNTPWGERHCYVIDAHGDTASTRTPKAMHVSPFLPMNVEYHVSWTAPGADLSLRIQVERAGDPIFEAHLELTHASLDNRRALALPLRYPLMPLRGLMAIYREAIRLLIRRVPVHAHPNLRTRKAER